MIQVGRRAHRHEDKAGDPLDGLVNLFDLGIVLSVGFLLAALTALHVAGSITDGTGGVGKGNPSTEITVPPDSTIRQVPSDGATVIGNGQECGKVYRLDSGELIYVVPTDAPSVGATSGAASCGTSAPTRTPRPQLERHPVSFFGNGLKEALKLIWAHDPYLVDLFWKTLQVAAIPTAVALVIGLPIGLAIGLGRWRGSGALRVLANAGLGLPPVVVGLVLALLMLPASPLGKYHLLFTFKGVLIAQTVLALPIIVALTSSAVRDIAPGLLNQARALDAGRVQVLALAAREARVGILAATIAAVGSGMSEVGAVVLVGGNIEGLDQTLASAALQNVDAGHFVDGLAIAVILLALILVVTAALTFLQYGRARQPWSMS